MDAYATQRTSKGFLTGKNAFVARCVVVRGARARRDHVQALEIRTRENRIGGVIFGNFCFDKVLVVIGLVLKVPGKSGKSCQS